ncbi:MAG: RDD family protein [Luteolibacter sp.]
MNQEINSDGGIPKSQLPKPSIPPPDLSRRPPPPPSPLDALPKSSPVASPAEPAVKVKIRTAGDAAGELAPSDGLASFNTRVVAAVIDLLVSLGVTIICVWLLPGLLGWLGQFVGLAYFVTRDSLPFLGGQSVGKKAMKLKVTTLEGGSLAGNWNVALIRNGILLIPFFALVELYLLLTRENGADRGRRLGDEWAKTRVVVEVKPADPEEAK